MNIIGSLNKILCWFGIHSYVAPLDEYVKQFGSIPLDGRICDGAVCEHCGKVFKKKEQQ